MISIFVGTVVCGGLLFHLHGSVAQVADADLSSGRLSSGRLSSGRLLEFAAVVRVFISGYYCSAPPVATLHQNPLRNPDLVAEGDVLQSERGEVFQQ
jgi:hypothetical protein